jgi:trans-aconitate methyltransferase
VELVADRAWAEQWQESWDRQQEGYMPDRETRFEALLDVVEAVGGAEPLVLDLACGTGSITRRLLERLPGARSIAVDVDPSLLSIAEATFAGDERVRIVRANLTDPAWTAALPETPVDAVVTATALHWLQPPALERLYQDLRGVVRPGGAVANADHMTSAALASLSDKLAVFEERRRAVVRADGRPAWSEWWDIAVADPMLSEAVAERNALFNGNHAAEFNPPDAWHENALRSAGFREVGIGWRSATDAMVVGIR